MKVHQYSRKQASGALSVPGFRTERAFPRSHNAGEFARREVGQASLFDRTEPKPFSIQMQPSEETYPGQSAMTHPHENNDLPNFSSLSQGYGMSLTMA